MEQITTISFDPTTKHAVIDLDTLDRTIKLEDVGRQRLVLPVNHSDFIKKVLLLASNHAPYEAASLPITIPDRNVRRIKWNEKEQGPAPVENFLIERLVGKIEFKDILFGDDDDTKGSLAVGFAYTEKGIQLAFGHNVNVCQNLNIFGDYIWSTYGDRDFKVPYEKGMELLEKWFSEYTIVRDLNVESVNRLKEITVPDYERERIIGKLFERAVHQNRGSRSVVAPLNQSECAAMVSAGYEHIRRMTVGNDGVLTGWDLTQWATSVLRPDKSDMTSLIECNRNLNAFMLAELN